MLVKTSVSPLIGSISAVSVDLSCAGIVVSGKALRSS